MNRINQVQKLTAAVAVVFLTGALTGCDNSTSKKVAENTLDPISAATAEFAQKTKEKAAAANTATR